MASAAQKAPNSSLHWEERVSSDQHNKIDSAVAEFMTGNIDGDKAYEIMTNNGMTSEEASEMMQILEAE